MSDTLAYQPTNAVDVVAVFDSGFNQLFPGARPMLADVKEAAKLMKHPVETGATINDFRIIEPIEIDLHMTLDASEYVNTYNQIKQVFLGDNVVTVQTKTGPYPNMCIEKMPHKEDPKIFDTVSMVITLKQVQFVSASTSPLPASAITQNGGSISGTQATATQTSNATTQVQQSSALYSAFYGK